MIARAAAILRVLRDSHSGMSLGQIAEQVGLPRSTVQRIVAALQQERLVIAQASGGGLRLGPELTTLAEAARFNVVERCRPLLTELARKTGETVDLSVLRGTGMVFLDQIAGTQRLRAISSVGEVFPLTDTANGRACLAMLPEDEARHRTQEEWARRGVSGDIEHFMSMLARMRERGIAHDLDEHHEGISALGFAFRDLAGDLHAISVPVPSTRFREKRQQIAADLSVTKAHVAAMMTL
ncbi:IclR family transcriptional regulator [Alkalilacustris brevis]|uniref:IclR family transcriptional regulator n=1 Tax=Alkalilacustris brevis TaxID=2026338 RepID=UPI00192E47FB|nr:IclR family transcriptional regulator [Alkalilacustris brevis]